MFGKKKEKTEAYLPFKLIPDTDESVTILAYGSVCCQPVYCRSVYVLDDPEMYENGDFAQILDSLRNPDNRRIKVTFTLKDARPADFRTDVQSIAEAYQDDRFLHLELLGWGLFDEEETEQLK